MSCISENAYLYLMALLFLLFVSPMSSISHNAESIEHALLFIFGVFPPTCAAADNDDDGLVDWSMMNAMALGSSSLVLSIIDATLGLQQDGGGICASDSTITMMNCQISGNTAGWVRFTIS